LLPNFSSPVITTHLDIAQVWLLIIFLDSDLGRS
jgi:hypothetical protein